MQKDTLTFHITLADAHKPDEDTAEQFSQEFIRSLGLKIHSGVWSDIDLDSPVMYDFLDRAEELVYSGKCVFYGFNHLCQKLVEEGEPCFEWYLLDPPKSIEYSWKNRLLTCKAYQMQANVHVAHGGRYVPFVSERFKRVVEEHGLTGLDFLWVIDKGRYRAMQWYLPIASEPLGRGVDHPWFNPETLKGDGWSQPRHPVFRTGVWRFEAAQVRDDIELDGDIYPRLLALYRSATLSIISHRTFLRPYLPDTDFAFVWECGDEPCLDGFGRARYLCMNRRAREILEKERVLSRGDFEPIMVLDEPPEGVEQLDGIAELPPAIYTPEEICDFNNKIAKHWDKHIAADKPIRVVKMKEALRMLRKAKRDFPEDYGKGIGARKLADGNVAIPDNWKQVLKVSNGCILNCDCEIIPYERIAELDSEAQSYIKSIFDEYPHTYLAVGHGSDGDWIALDRSEAFDADCKVFRISHEDLSILKIWDSIPVFVHEMLCEFD